MVFRTQIEPIDFRGVINHSDEIMMLGSCFSDNIGRKLEEALFDVDINPFGTSFNPISIADNIDRALSGEMLDESDLFLHNGMWSCFNFHSSFSKSDKENALRIMNMRIATAHLRILQAKTVIITWGTAFIFTDRESGNVVNNCHKLPAAQFMRKRIDIDCIVKKYVSLIDRIICVNPAIKIIFTVSPIRHIADGLQDNQLSKCILRAAVEEIVNLYPHNAIYFPAYEIMMDDLRDYRFYAADMIHPAETAIDYIYDIFSRSFFDPATTLATDECAKLTKRLNHRFMTDNQAAIIKFKEATENIKMQLINKYPYLQNRIELNNNQQ